MDVEKNDGDKNLRPFVDLMNLKKESATLKMKQKKLYNSERKKRVENKDRGREGEKKGVKRGK